MDANNCKVSSSAIDKLEKEVTGILLSGNFDCKCLWFVASNIRIVEVEKWQVEME